MNKQICAVVLTLCLCLAMAVPANAADVGKTNQRNVLSVGYRNVASIKEDNSLWMLGTNLYGTTASGTDSKGSIVPVKMMDGVLSVASAAVSSGTSYAPVASTAVIKNDHSLWLFVGNTTPVHVTDQVSAVSVQEDHGLLLVKNDSSLWSGAYTGFKKIMDGVTAISTSCSTNAVIKADGSLWMWGRNEHGQLGNGSVLNGAWETVKTPTKVMDNVTAVSVSEFHTMAIKTDGSLWGWGDNTFGQLGNSRTGNYTKPAAHNLSETLQTVPVKIMDGATAVNTGTYSSAAIKTDGSLWTWGRNDHGQLGNGGKGNETVSYYQHAPDGTAGDVRQSTIQSIPVKVADNAAAVSMGSSSIAVTKMDGTVWTAGYICYTIAEGNTLVKRLDGAALPSAAKFEPEPTIGGFSDVKANSYYADAVLWAVQNGITSGTNGTTFSPTSTCTKAQILTFIWRAAGRPSTTIANPFQDIKSSDYYYKAALWAYAKGMVSGSAFAGASPCTRSMAVTYLWQAAGSQAVPAASQFTDVRSDAPYAKAIAWAVKNGITGGTSGTTFSPDSTCTRAQIVTFLYRCKDMNLNVANPSANASARYAAALSAYQSALRRLYAEHIYPDGYSDGYTNESKCQFAILDIDRDGKEELIVNNRYIHVYGGIQAVYGFDETTREIKREIFSGPDLMCFYDNGIVKVDDSHHHQLSGIEYWPYTMQKYDQTSDTYVETGRVYAWDGTQYPVGWDNEMFPNTVDDNGNRIIFYISALGGYVDDLEYSQWLNSVLDGAKKVDFSMRDLTLDNITKIAS